MSCRIARYDWKPFISTVFLSVGYIHSFRTYAFCIQLEAGIQSIPGNNRRCCNGQFCVLGTNKSWFHSYKNNVGSLLLPQSIFLRRLYESYIMIHPLCIRPHKQLIIYIYILFNYIIISSLGDVLFPIACDALPTLFIRKSAPRYI